MVPTATGNVAPRSRVAGAIRSADSANCVRNGIQLPAPSDSWSARKANGSRRATIRLRNAAADAPITIQASAPGATAGRRPRKQDAAAAEPAAMPTRKTDSMMATP